MYTSAAFNSTIAPISKDLNCNDKKHHRFSTLRGLTANVERIFGSATTYPVHINLANFAAKWNMSCSIDSCFLFGLTKLRQITAGP